jgi:predicted 3-demethylubiquinone-9 3-methyltransferase (glyoxalase superfamily)
MQKIVPCLWFENREAEEAIRFYSSVFKNVRTVDVLRNGKEGPGPEGSVLMVSFELDGVPFQALNGGPHETFNDAISLSVDCKSQEEVDHYWEKLVDGGGRHIQCGWLKDRFGISWQIVPDMLPRLLRDPDKAKAARVMLAMMQMVKLDIDALEKAARG